jgi:hypothetical protein
MIILEAEMAEAFRNGFEPRRFNLPSSERQRENDARSAGVRLKSLHAAADRDGQRGDALSNDASA